MPKSYKPVEPNSLPTWTDPASVASYITSLVSVLFAGMATMSDSSRSAMVQALVPSVALIVAAVAQIVNVITHRGVHKAAIAASAKQTQ